MDTTFYRGRLAPSPTGLLHLGHARTFWIAQERARRNGGVLVLRNEDLDPARCKPQFVAAMLEDLRWFGLDWREGPDRGGPFAPYSQSERQRFYRSAFEKLQSTGMVYPCYCSRQDILRSAQAPHADEDEPIYPNTCRPPDPSSAARPRGAANSNQLFETQVLGSATRKPNWRFRVPDGEAVAFVDGCQGGQSFVAGREFGDFVIWRHDDLPAYQLAVVVDDAAMRVSEVVRGADLLRSTARQILLYRALQLPIPAFYHCQLMTDEFGIRLAKRHEALSLRRLREQGNTPESLRASWPADSTAKSLSTENF